MSADAQSFKDIMSHWATGISVVTTQYQGEWQGFTVNSFASVSIAPLLISLSVTKDLYAGKLIHESRVFAVNILTNKQEEFGRLFAGMIPERREKRFEGLNVTLDTYGCPLLPEILGWLSCRVYQELDVGASTLILGEVTDCGRAENAGPLVYYHRQWGEFAPFKG